MSKVFIKIVYSITLIALLSLSVTTHTAESATVDDLRNRIEERNKQVKSLEQEIAVFQSQLQAVSQEKAGLERELKEIELSRKKLSADIELIQQRINTADLTIQKLSLEVEEKQRRIEQNKKAIRLALQKIDEYDNQTLVEAFLSQKGISDFWSQVDKLQQFQTSLKRDLDILKTLQAEVEARKQETLETKKELVSLRGELDDKKVLADQARSDQQTLIAQTRNQESKYEAILREKQQQKLQFEQDLFTLESELKIAIDPSKLPTTRPGVLSWPLRDIYITQNFGKTVDAQRLYTSGTHNGVDFRAARGTEVHAALSGVVQATGNTDLQRGCYSYGKWVLIKHNNGLSTLYAHLDLIKVNQGQTVTTGDVIGYSGNTGYSTGPHLHFTLYASEGVRVQQYSTSINCKQVSIPIADQRAYLDPLEYLPAFSR